MLFAIDGNGTPSVSTTISISGPATSPGSAYGKTVNSMGPAVYWPLNDARARRAQPICPGTATSERSVPPESRMAPQALSKAPAARG